jgi:hypothetical protein
MEKHNAGLTAGDTGSSPVHTLTEMKMRMMMIFMLTNIENHYK